MNAPYYTIDITNSSQIATITSITYNINNESDDTTIDLNLSNTYIGKQLFYVSEIPNVVEAVVKDILGKDYSDDKIKTVSIKLHKLKYASNDNVTCGFVFGQVYNGDMEKISYINFSTLCESDIFKTADLSIEFVKTFKGIGGEFDYTKVIAQSCENTTDEPSALTLSYLTSDKSLLTNLLEGYHNIDDLRDKIIDKSLENKRKSNPDLWFIYNLLCGYFIHEYILSGYVTTIVECNKNFESNKNANEFDTALSTYILIVNYEYENKSQFITSARNELTSIYVKVKQVLSNISEEAKSLNQNVSNDNVETFMSNYESLNNVYEAYNEVCKTYQNSADDFNFDDINIINDMNTLLLKIHGELDSAYAKYNALITEGPSGDTSEGPSGDTSEEPSEGPSEGESDTIE